MSNIPGAAARAARQRLGKTSALTRFALIGVALAAVIGTFAYVGGGVSPDDLTPPRGKDGFEDLDGGHPRLPRQHAKGGGGLGFFLSKGDWGRLSQAVVF